MNELTAIEGECIQVGDVNVADLAQFAGRPGLTMLAADREVLLVGLTREECRACLPGFMGPLRIAVRTNDPVTIAATAKLAAFAAVRDAAHALLDALHGDSDVRTEVREAADVRRDALGA